MPMQTPPLGWMLHLPQLGAPGKWIARARGITEIPQ